MSSASLAHVLARVSVVEQRVRELVDGRKVLDPEPDDPFRGLYLSDDRIEHLLAGIRVDPTFSEAAARLAACEQVADDEEEKGSRLRLREVSATFGLTPLDTDLLVIALACDVDARFEQLFGYLNDDVTRRRPTAAVALELCGVPLSLGVGHARLLHGALTTGGLMELEDPDRPFPGRMLRIPDRVVRHLLGDDKPDLELASVTRPTPDIPWGDPRTLADALRSNSSPVYLREHATGSGRVLATEALRLIDQEALLVDLDRLLAQPDPARMAGLVVREIRLRGGGLVVGPVRPNAPLGDLVDRLTAEPRPTVFVGQATWDPVWSQQVPLLLDVPASTATERRDLWRFVLAGSPVTRDGVDETSQFRLTPEGVSRAARAAQVQARVSVDGVITGRHLRSGARAENGTALERLARRVEPEIGWQDLVLPAGVQTALHEVALRARHREMVLGDWRMRPGGGRGHGVAALFAGDSGTGKTMSAEVIAGELGLDLYVVDLATVIDKYIGETEKNLERIFTAAAGVNAVLLFDEADAVFGRRSEVRDAHDRYANIESAYLLQRMETFDGLAILATNLRANIDEAFTRRLDVVVDFPLPDALQRLALWDRCLGATIRRGKDLDLAFCSEAFELSGGAIRSTAVTAAYLAADDGGQVEMRHLITAVQREYRKLGRLCLESEFGRYWPLLV